MGVSYRKIRDLLPINSQVRSVNVTNKLTQKRIGSKLYPRLEVIYDWNNERYRTYLSVGMIGLKHGDITNENIDSINAARGTGK
jgi:hypothetical protein